MKQSRYTEEQIGYVLRQVDSGTPVGDACRQLGVSEAKFYAWKKKFAHLGVRELRRMRQLEEENRRLKALEHENAMLKRMYADLALENAAIKDVLNRKL